jgi:hypothetical protein
MSTSFWVEVDRERVIIRLYSLSEYEADGGCYSDAGNDGEDLVAETAAEVGITVEMPGPNSESGYGIYLLATDPADQPMLERIKRQIRAQFVCAATTESIDALWAAGLAPEDYWYDSATGYFLLREFPPEAPLAARMVESASTA